ncbi:hypothetical protein [Dactylosporangium sp. NPDC005555]|uniref:hypothetical protein n=1 Tax=Dactylosporangium sp. NPDC005555 TaxID=3154889 RepID=UPI0033B2B299
MHTDPDDGALRTALHDYATGGEPALGLTSAGMLTAGRRAGRRRRTFQALGVAAVLTVAAVAAAQLTTPDAPPTSILAATAAPSGPAAAARPCTGLTVGPDASGEDRGHAITCFATTVVPGMLPGATLTQPTGQGAPPGTLALHAYPHSWGRGFNADALVTDAAGVGLVFIVVRPRDPADPPPDKDTCVAPGCERRTGPHGEPAGVYHKPEAEGTSTGWTVAVYSAGSTVSVTSGNHTPDTLMATRPAPPLTVEQLWQLATDPRLQVYG